MKKTFTLLTLFLPFLIQAQLLNGSFETNGGTPSTANWQHLCYAPESNNDAAPGWGEHSIKQAYGNSQGCFPSFVYQPIAEMDDGEVWTISGWARIDGLWSATNVGIFLGKVSGPDLVSTNSGAWTSASEWTYLSKTDTVRLSAGQTGAVVLMAGMVPGPLYGFAYFDGIELSGNMSLSIDNAQPDEISIFPSPAEEVLYLGSSEFTSQIDLRIYDLTGQLEQQQAGLNMYNGSTIKLDVSMLKTGLHIVQLEQRGQIFTKRFYKK